MLNEAEGHSYATMIGSKKTNSSGSAKCEIKFASLYSALRSFDTVPAGLDLSESRSSFAGSVLWLGSIARN